MLCWKLEHVESLWMSAFDV